MSTLDNPASADPEKIGQFLRNERLRVVGQTAHDHDKRYSFDEAAIYVAWASEEVRDLVKHRAAIAELNDRLRKALAGMLGLGCSPTAIPEHPVCVEARAALQAVIQKAQLEKGSG